MVLAQHFCYSLLRLAGTRQQQSRTPAVDWLDSLISLGGLLLLLLVFRYFRASVVLELGTFKQFHISLVLVLGTFFFFKDSYPPGPGTRQFFGLV
jgi:hypothetical protein